MLSWLPEPHAPDCPNDFPDSHNYKELTEDILLNHKWINNVPSRSRPIRAVTLSTHIEEVTNKNNASFVAMAIMPLVVLSSVSETEEDVSVPLVALNNSSSSLDSHLHEYIKLVPYAPGSAWISQTVKAIVTPNLYVPLLLDLPFLTVNHIVTDFKTHTTINKENKYDLLNPPS